MARGPHPLALAVLVAGVLVPLAPATAQQTTACPFPDGPAPARIDGPDRVATAADVALADRRGDVDRVVLAAAGSSADAAVAAVAAAALEVPLLLVGRDAVPEATAAALDALDADGDHGELVLVGGTAAIGAAVADDLAADGWSVRRVAGPDRYATASAVAALSPDRADGPLVVAAGPSWPDTTVGAAAAATGGGQLVLTRPDDASDLVELARGRDVSVVGGAAAVDEGAYATLAEVAGSIRRLAGTDRVTTSAAVAASRPGAPVLVATAADWPDAVVAAAAAPGRDAVVVLSGAAVDPAVQRVVRGREATVVGGTAALAVSTAGALADAAAADPGAPTVTATPVPCTTVTGTVGEVTTLAVAASAGVLADVDVQVAGPADRTVAIDGATVTLELAPTGVGTSTVALTATATVDGAERSVRAAWVVEVPAPTTPTAEGWLRAAGTGPVTGTAGPVTTYTVEVADGLEARQDVAGFAAFVDATLGDPARGWTSTGDRRLQRVDGDAPIRVVLATPATVDRLCARAGLDTAGVYSCWNGRFAALNSDRWFGGVGHVPDLGLYRTYLVNHEVGHGLGFGHRACPAPGALAPVMMQLTKSTYGCTANGWPFP